MNPSTYNRVIRIPPPTERPLLLTNEEALEILNHTKIPRKPSLKDSPVQVSFASILKGGRRALHLSEVMLDGASESLISIWIEQRRKET